jgi:hypothetical protein
MVNVKRRSFLIDQSQCSLRYRVCAPPNEFFLKIEHRDSMLYQLAYFCNNKKQNTVKNFYIFLYLFEIEKKYKFEEFS